MRAWRRLTAIGVLALGLATASSFAPAIAAPSLPSDPAAAGSIGLCDRTGHPVTSGSTTDKPFVWRAVGSKQAPPPFDGQGTSATLYAYQPRPNVPAAQWSGDTLTASSAYTNKAHPMAQATQLDFTLQDYLAEYPPMQNGLVQLRLLVGAVGQGAAPKYATAFVRVVGSSWSLVSGSSDFSCTDGRATSSEVYGGVVDRSGNAIGTAAASLSASAGSASSAAARSRSASPASVDATGSPRPSAGAASSSGPVASTASAGTVAGSTTSDGGSGGRAVVVALLVVAFVAAGAGAVVWRRRRSRGPAAD